jgi:hypothetical protein
VIGVARWNANFVIDYAAFLSMAQQSNLLDVRARWLALAQDCLTFTKKAQDRKLAERRSKSITDASMVSRLN